MAKKIQKIEAGINVTFVVAQDKLLEQQIADVFKNLAARNDSVLVCCVESMIKQTSKMRIPGLAGLHDRLKFLGDKKFSISGNEIALLISVSIQHHCTLKQGAKPTSVIVIGTPHNEDHVDHILELCPGARLLFIRDTHDQMSGVYRITMMNAFDRYSERCDDTGSFIQEATLGKTIQKTLLGINISGKQRMVWGEHCEDKRHSVYHKINPKPADWVHPAHQATVELCTS